MTMMSTPNKETILNNIQVWQKDRADALASKAERQRKQRVRHEHRAFNQGFNSLAELLPRNNGSR